MITNERQYRITKAQADRFAQALKDFGKVENPEQRIDPRIVNAQRDSLKATLSDLGAELFRYESLRAGKMRRLPIAGIAELGVKLIEARIARGLSQRDLAERLGMKEQQIQRYEQERYATANLTRCAEIADALALDLRAHFAVRKSRRAE